MKMRMLQAFVAYVYSLAQLSFAHGNSGENVFYLKKNFFLKDARSPLGEGVWLGTHRQKHKSGAYGSWWFI